MKQKEIVEKYKKSDLKNLFKREKELEEKILDLKIKLSLGKLKNTSELKMTKRELARVKTFIRQKVLPQVVKESKK